METDRQLAEHVTYVHQKGVHPPLEFEPLLPTFIRAYVAQAREFKPYIPPELSSTIVEVGSAP